MKHEAYKALGLLAAICVLKSKPYKFKHSPYKPETLNPRFRSEDLRPAPWIRPVPNHELGADRAQPGVRVRTSDAILKYVRFEGFPYYGLLEPPESR